MVTSKIIEQLKANYGELMRAIAWNILRNKEDVEDAMQEAFLSLSGEAFASPLSFIALQLFFVLIVVLVALILVLLLTFHTVILLHFLSPPKVFEIIMAEKNLFMRIFPGKITGMGVVFRKSLC